MGPHALFDKSFLQSLSVDESVWFDRFFVPVICPLFFVETLADLEKTVRQGRSPEQEVGIIADKVPEMSGSMIAHHSSLAIGTLMGYDLPLDFRVPRPGGRIVTVEGKTGLVYEPSQEEEAFERWRQRDFLEVERRFAKVWRTALNSMDLMAVAAGVRALGVAPEACTTLDVARKLADSFVRRTDFMPDRVKLALIILGVENNLGKAIENRMATAGWPPLAESAPFAAHLLAVEIFFQISVAAGLIGAERVSNRTDVAYLYYLPFCHLFVSTDKLHRRCAPHFLRDDQSFVWGAELKADLARLNEYYSGFSESEKEKGLMAFASQPPQAGGYLVTKLWDKHMPGWKNKPGHLGPEDQASSERIIDEIKRFSDAPEASIDNGLGQPDAMLIRRMVNKKKGSWWQLPRDLKD